MLISSTQNIISVLGLVASISAAPLNERASSKRGIVGWLCHYDGPSSPTVDVSLDLPSMLGGLCAKVNYDYPGCESFDPNTKPITPEQLPQDEGTGVQSQSVDDDEAQPNDDDRDPTHKKKKNQHHPVDTPDQTLSEPKDEDDNDPTHKRPKHKKTKNHPKNSVNDDDKNINPQSFNDVGGKEPKSSHHSHGSKPHKVTSEEDPNTSVNSLSDDESDDDDAHGCKNNEYYSSEANRCIDQSYFAKPQSDGLCKIGNFDAVLNLCLDVSILGLTDPIHVEASVLRSGSGGNGVPKCPLGQQYSSLLSVCVNDQFFSDPLVNHQCENGWKLDLVLGICLDLVGCQNQS